MVDTEAPPPLGFLVNDLRLALRAAYEEALQSIPLTVPRVGALLGIEGCPGISIAGLAQAKFVAPQSIAEHIAALEDAGLITRRHPEGHGHVVALHLTLDGQRTLGRAKAAMRRVEDRLWGDLPPAETRRLRELLQLHLVPLQGAQRGPERRFAGGDRQ